MFGFGGAAGAIYFYGEQLEGSPGVGGERGPAGPTGPAGAPGPPGIGLEGLDGALVIAPGRGGVYSRGGCPPATRSATFATGGLGPDRVVTDVRADLLESDLEVETADLCVVDFP